jgi:chromosome segregation ATPase
LNLFYHLYRKIKEVGLSKQDITELVQSKDMSKELREDIAFYHKCISELKSTKLALEQEINSLQRRIDNYDGITPI